MVYLPPVHPRNPRNSASMAGSDVLAALGKHNTPWVETLGLSGKATFDLDCGQTKNLMIHHAEYNI